MAASRYECTMLRRAAQGGVLWPTRRRYLSHGSCGATNLYGVCPPQFSTPC